MRRRRHLTVAPAPPAREQRPKPPAGLSADAVRGPMSEVAELAALALAVPGAVVSLVGAGGDHVHGAVERDASERGLAAGVARLCQRVVATATPMCATNVGVGRSGEVGAFAGVPLTLAGGGVAGTLAVVAAPSRTWTPLDVRLLAGLAARAATEIELALAELGPGRTRDPARREDRRQSS